jgi:diguanylate cyclase (GGDEF)-like protein
VIAAASHQASRITVAFIDLDRFKLINDSLGHAAGDALLQAIAARLLECVRESDTVARLGGDEFVILLPDELADAALIPWLQRIVERIAQPVVLLDEEHAVTCSIGVSIYPQDGDNSETLLKHADTAMYRAKEIGRNSFQFFMPEMNVRLTNRLRLETDLQRALERGEFELYYQPQVDLRSGAISGCEALIRWHHPQRGLVLPAHFIPTAEESDLILAIGAWVIRQAAAQCQSWRAAGLPALPVAVNLSARQFDRQDIPALIASVLEETALEPGWLEVEITEGLSMQAPHRTLEFIRQLRTLGVGVAIDDFGTGFSNLSYLKRFPVNKLKLDYSFVNGIASNPEDIAISTAIIEMGHSLHLKVIAEGVERASQLAILAARGCDQLQGYLFSPPLTADDFAALVRSGRRLSVPHSGKPQTQPTLLIVDDDRLALSSLRRALTAQPYRVLLVAGAAQAFELLATQRVDVLLSDHRMPEMNGLEFLEKVRHMYPGIVRLMLSGFAEQDLLLNAINQRTLFKFLCKPWTHEELCQALEEAFALATSAR